MKYIKHASNHMIVVRMLLWSSKSNHISCHVVTFLEFGRETCFASTVGSDTGETVGWVPWCTEELSRYYWGTEEGIWRTQGQGWKKCKRNWDADAKTTENICELRELYKLTSADLSFNFTYIYIVYTWYVYRYLVSTVYIHWTFWWVA